MELIMTEEEIAISKAKLLHKLSNWSTYSRFDHGSSVDREQLEFERLANMITKLAKFRSLANKKDFKTALLEVELQISIHLAKLLEPTIDPALAGTRPFVIVEEDDVDMVCGVCQEEMEKEEEARVIINCMHTFHDSCILKWLKIKSTCPLCRIGCKPNNLHFPNINII